MLSSSLKDLFDDILADRFTWLPGDRVAYSNPAYTLLGYATENITGRSFNEMLQDDILTPLGLASTSMDPPSLEEAIIPVGAGELFMGFDIGTYNAFVFHANCTRGPCRLTSCQYGGLILHSTRYHGLRPLHSQLFSLVSCPDTTVAETHGLRGRFNS